MRQWGSAAVQESTSLPHSHIASLAHCVLWLDAHLAMLRYGIDDIRKVDVSRVA